MMVCYHENPMISASQVILSVVELPAYIYAVIICLPKKSISLKYIFAVISRLPNISQPNICQLSSSNLINLTIRCC